MVKIIFYNSFNFGDVYFCQPFINNIVNNNGSKFEYYIWFQYGCFSFSDISSIHRINEYTDCNQLFDMIGDIKKYMYYNFFDITIENEQFLFINTWIGSMHYRYHSIEMKQELFKDYLIECDLISYNKCYEVIVNEIYKKYNIYIHYENNVLLSYPSFPKTVNIHKFNEYFDDKTTVFINNYNPISGQTVSITSSDDFITVIDFFLKKGYTVLLPQDDEIIMNKYGIEKNVYFCSYIHTNILNIQLNDYHLSTELFYNAKMCISCHVSIYFDSGRNFMYFNSDFMNDFLQNNKNKKIHLSTTEYYDKYFPSLNNKLIVPNNYASQYVSNNINEVINVLSNII
jgi:hypothetical protein